MSKRSTLRSLARPLSPFSLTLAMLVACGQGDQKTPVAVSTVTSVAAQTPSTSAFQDAVAKVLPAVVYIQVEARPPQQVVLTPFGPQMQGGSASPLVPYGSGSGVIFSPDGYVLTNNHVVQEAERVTVTTYDRRTFVAQVIARDPSTDIAVVQIKGDKIPYATLGTASALKLGQWVLALGSPLGLRFTVTAGIVSATGRSIGILNQLQQQQPPVGPGQPRGQTAAPLEDYIQTDAAINPGNSGGPLIDLDGRVIGINSAIASPTGVYAGYGFAVPIDLARRVAEELIKYGEVRRPYLGVSLKDVDQVDARVFGLAAPEGAAVVRIEPGGPADKAGMQLGDVITQIGGKHVGTVAELQAELAQMQPNSTVPVQVVRYGRQVTLQVHVAQVTSGVKPTPTEANGESRASAGIQVAQQGNQVVVAGVEPYSAAARAGVRPGQVILAADRQPISSVQQLVDIVRGDRSQPLSLIVNDPNVGRTIVNIPMQ